MKKVYCGFLMLFCLALSACNEKKEPRSIIFFGQNESIAREVVEQCKKDRTKVVEGECENAQEIIDHIDFANVPRIKFE